MSRLIESIVEVVTRYDRFYNDFRVIKLTVNQLAPCIFGSGGCLSVWFVLGAFCVTCRCYCRLFWAVTCLFFFHRFTTDLHTHTQMGFSILLLLGLVVAALFLIFLVCVLSICFVNLCCPSESVHPYNQRPYVIGQSPYVIGQRQDDFVWKP